MFRHLEYERLSRAKHNKHRSSRFYNGSSQSTVDELCWILHIFKMNDSGTSMKLRAICVTDYSEEREAVQCPVH